MSASIQLASVSVIVPTIGRPESLARLLDSLAAQTRRVREVLVADGSGTDGISAVTSDPRFAAAGLAVRRLAGHAGMEFLPPRISPWKQFAERYSSGKLIYAYAGAGAVAGIWVLQSRKITDYETRIQALKEESARLAPQLAKIRKLTAEREEVNKRLGIIASLVICTVLYIAVAAVLSGIIDVTTFRTNVNALPGVASVDAVESARFLNAPVAYVLSVLGMDWAAGLVSAGAVAGITSVLLVMLMSQPRIFFSMSRDRLLPAGVSKVHPRFGTPYITTISGAFGIVSTTRRESVWPGSKSPISRVIAGRVPTGSKFSILPAPW